MKSRIKFDSGDGTAVATAAAAKPMNIFNVIFLFLNINIPFGSRAFACAHIDFGLHFN